MLYTKQTNRTDENFQLRIRVVAVVFENNDNNNVATAAAADNDDIPKRIYK